jgi:high-affinity Fe2+/Pb2+ permease
MMDIYTAIAAMILSALTGMATAFLIAIVISKTTVRVRLKGGRP